MDLEGSLCGIKEHIYISHKNDPDTKYEISIGNIKKSKFLETAVYLDSTIINSEKSIIINEGSLPEFNFIIRYLDFYENCDEIDPPEHPLVKDKLIHEIFEFEYVVFKDIIDMENFNERILLLRNILYLANYMEMEKFYKKIAAILAYYLLTIQNAEEMESLREFLRKYLKD